MKEPTKTELVFEDLCQLYFEINNNRRNPRLFRLAFESYIFKSQQLTEAMRSEYKQRTGEKWFASKFEGWNQYTAAIKKIRNAALHGCPIVLDEAVLSIYENVEFSTDSEEISNKKYRAAIGRSFITNPLSNKSGIRGTGYPLKNKSSNDPHDINNYALPIKEYIFYELRWDLLELGVLSGITEGQRTDALKLILKSFPRIQSYMNYYKTELEKHQYDLYKPDYWIKPKKGIGWVVNPKYKTSSNET